MAYVRSGRGGAGNFAPKETQKPLEVEMQAKGRAMDLEAQPTDPADATSIVDVAASAPAPQYKTQGRGGAGNWYEPAALKQTGTFGTADGNPTADNSQPDPNKRSSRVWQGRGGAGNWEADQQQKEELKRKSMLGNVDSAALEALKQEAKVEAEKEIRPPQPAHTHVPHLDRHKNLGDETHDI